MEKQCRFKVYLYTDKDNMEQSFVEDIHSSLTESEKSYIGCAGFEDVLLVVNDLKSIYTDKQYFVHIEYTEVSSKNKVFETEWNFEL